MIIGVDGNEANVHEHVGVSVYTLALLNYFQSVASEKVSFCIFLRQKPMASMPKKNPYFHYEVVSGPFLWSQIFLPFHLYTKSKIDLYFAPAHYIPRFCPVPIVVTIHDLSFFYYPQEFRKKDLFQLKNWTARAINKSKAIIAVSKTTKKDIVKWYQVPDKKISVIYNGFEKKSEDKSDKEVLKKYNISEKKYILYVGTLQPRKNIVTLIRAFNDYYKTHEGLKLVIVGKKGWLYDEIFGEVNRLNLNLQVVFTDFIPDEDVIVLYKNAWVFVMPSLYEGFGIPILEAMAYGCPVISSQNSSLPEIGGEACLYFDPSDPNDLIEKWYQLAQSKEIYNKLINTGKNRIASFSWKRCAHDTLELLKNQTKI